jgi:hypothetical protein
MQQFGIYIRKEQNEWQLDCFTPHLDMIFIRAHMRLNEGYSISIKELIKEDHAHAE